MKHKHLSALLPASLALLLGLCLAAPLAADERRHGYERQDHQRGQHHDQRRHYRHPGKARGHYKKGHGHKARHYYPRYPARPVYYKPRYPVYYDAPRRYYRPYRGDRLHYSVTIPFGYNGSLTLWQ